MIVPHALRDAAGEGTPAPGSPFDAVASSYDEDFAFTPSGAMQRRAVWREMDRVFGEGQRILELNCGTGIDAVRLASRGVRVCACDASPAMIEAAERRVRAARAEQYVELRCVPTERVGLRAPGDMFDGLLSNFAGLNCIEDLPAVAGKLAGFVRPGGHAVLCVFGRWCAWEIGWFLLHGQLRKSLRRVLRREAEVRIAPGAAVTVRYPSVRALAAAFGPHFRLVRLRGAGVAVPPPYVRIPRRAFRAAALVDRAAARIPGLRVLGDHVVVVLRRSA